MTGSSIHHQTFEPAKGQGRQVMPMTQMTQSHRLVVGFSVGRVDIFRPVGRDRFWKRYALSYLALTAHVCTTEPK